MTEEKPMDFTIMAVIGLYFIATGIVFLFSFIIKATGGELPAILEFQSEYYGLLIMSVVNFASALGLLYRSKNMWSVTLVFTIVMIAGSVMNIFFKDAVNAVLIVASILVFIGLMTNKARLWYKVL